MGTLIATLGLPQINEINEEAKAPMQQMFGEKTRYDYAYLYSVCRRCYRRKYAGAQPFLERVTHA